MSGSPVAPPAALPPTCEISSTTATEDRRGYRGSGPPAILPAHRAVRTNLLISLATLAMSAVARLSFVQEARVADFQVKIAGMLIGGIAAA
jgi:hypothetical protein